MSADANEVNEDVFRKARALDDKGLEEEAKLLLGGNDVVLEESYFQGKYLDSTIAPAVLIYENKGDGVVHSRAAEGRVDILPTGPKAATANELRILVFRDSRTGLVFRNVLLRRFIARVG